jgi:hypothetical protein
MAISADKVVTPPVLTDDDGPRKKWVDQAARTTAVLAVLAAISSGQYANQFSHTILAQAEASDEWSFYQAKSIKRHLVNGQAELAAALEVVTKTDPAEKLEAWRQQNAAETRRYDAELAGIKSKAEAIEAKKIKHGQQGFWFQIAFAVLQAGVVLSTIAASSRRRELWVVAILCGLLGAVIALNGMLLVVPAPAGI